MPTGPTQVDTDRQVQQHRMFQVDVDGGPAGGGKAGCLLLTLVAGTGGQGVIQFNDLTEGLIDSYGWLGLWRFLLNQGLNRQLC